MYIGILFLDEVQFFICTTNKLDLDNLNTLIHPLSWFFIHLKKKEKKKKLK